MREDEGDMIWLTACLPKPKSSFLLGATAWLGSSTDIPTYRSPSLHPLISRQKVVEVEDDVMRTTSVQGSTVFIFPVEESLKSIGTSQ